MKIELAAVALVVLVLCATVDAQAGVGSWSLGPLGPPSFCEIHLNILQSEANKINTPDLPEDLRIRLATVLETAALGCSDCDNLVIWQNKVCLVMNLRASLNALSQIKAEADARTTTAAASVSTA